MSKKIYIRVSGRPDLRESFHNGLRSALNAVSRLYSSSYDDSWDNYGYDEDYYWDQWYPEVTVKDKYRKKKSKRGGRKRRGVEDDYDVVFPVDVPYDGEEEEWREGDIPYDYDDAPRVCFYDDYTDNSSRIDFQTLKEFDDFCVESGYLVYEDAAREIAETETAHCCLDPYGRAYGNSILIVGNSYSEMASYAMESEKYCDRL